MESRGSVKTLRALAAVAAAGVIAAIVIARPASAQDWPNRPLTMVAPFATGGSTDAIARIVADGLSSQLHQPVIVENIGGAGGMTGANRVAKATPDGYQFVLGNVGTHATKPNALQKAGLQCRHRFCARGTHHRSVLGAGDAQGFSR